MKKISTKKQIIRKSKKVEQKVVYNDLIIYLRKIGYPNLAKLITPKNAQVKSEQKVRSR